MSYHMKVGASWEYIFLFLLASLLDTPLSQVYLHGMDRNSKMLSITITYFSRLFPSPLALTSLHPILSPLPSSPSHPLSPLILSILSPLPSHPLRAILSHLYPLSPSHPLHAILSHPPIPSCSFIPLTLPSSLCYPLSPSHPLHAILSHPPIPLTQPAPLALSSSVIPPTPIPCQHCPSSMICYKTCSIFETLSCSCWPITKDASEIALLW